MASVPARVDGWVDLVGELLARPPTTLPIRLLMSQFHESFDGEVSWNRLEPKGAFEFDVFIPVPGWPTATLDAELPAAVGHHPVMAWYRATGRPTPMSSGRVPPALVSAKGRALVRTHLLPLGLEQQLVVPLWLDPPHHAAFVLARGQEDYSAEDMRVAWQIQPLLQLLERQLHALRGEPWPEADPCGLTGRELAVVRLVAEGLTAERIGRRLAISPRTVHRHLSNAYRKLGVRDRVCAVMAARDAGLLPAGGPARSFVTSPTGAELTASL